MERRRTARILAAALFIMGGFGMVLAHEEDEDHRTAIVQGEILDLACYVAHEAQGPDHAGCAKSCVKGGQPMGLLADDGTVYLLYASHKDGAAFEAAKEYAGQKVEITGAAANRAGIKGIEVNGVKPLGE